MPTSGTIPHGTVPLPPTTAGRATAQVPSTSGGSSSPGKGSSSRSVTIPGSGSYMLRLASASGEGPCPTPGLGGSYVAFVVSVSNTATAAEPSARIAVAVDNPAEAPHREVAAISYSGLCIDFTEPGGKLAPRQTVTYLGTASGVTTGSVITASLISTPANDDLGSVRLAVGKA